MLARMSGNSKSGAGRHDQQAILMRAAAKAAAPNKNQILFRDIAPRTARLSPISARVPGSGTFAQWAV